MSWSKTIPYLNIADIRPCTEAEGPGYRFAIWFQGCNLRCPGCCNPEMQAFEPRHIVEESDLIKLILAAKQDMEIEGISLIGGEPFLQAENIVKLAKSCHQHGLSVLAFTGFTIEELKAGCVPGSEKLLEHVDILVDGPFEINMPDMKRGWVGSTNQRVHYLTEFYQPGLEFSSENSIEFLVDSEGIRVNGWPFETLAL